MNRDEPDRPDGTIDRPTEPPAEGAVRAANEFARTLLRVAVGAAAEGGDALIRRLAAERVARSGTDLVESNDSAGDLRRDGEHASLEEVTLVRARQAMIGLLFGAVDLAGRGTLAAARGATAAGKLGGAILGPLARSRWLDPVRLPWSYLGELGAEQFDRWARRGRTEELRGREAARKITATPVEEILAHLRDDPEMERLVRSQAQALLAELARDPDLATVVREQGDVYLDHLRSEPDSVHELVRGQSMSLAQEVANSVRRYAIVVDDLLERIVRAVLRRRPRSQVDGPSPAVRHRAGVHARAGPAPLGEYAGFASRLLGFVIDSALLSLISTATVWAAVALLGWLHVDLLDCPPLGEEWQPGQWLCHGVRFAGLVAAPSFPILYTVFFWATAGQTPGKSVMGVRVVRLDGGAMTVWTSLRRMIGYLLSLGSLGAGFLSILADDRRQGLHDKFAQTCVVHSWSER
jgi:uncharacterized RDD family membrane protein YckC